VQDGVVRNMRKNFLNVNIKVWNIKKCVMKKLGRDTMNGYPEIPSKFEPLPNDRQLFDEQAEARSKKIRSILSNTLINKKELVLIYQMGKVGSTSFQLLLRDIDRFEVFHLHRLNQVSNDSMIDRYLSTGCVELALKEIEWKEIADYIQVEKPQINVVTAMRDPIARNISAFFQNIDLEDLRHNDVENLIDKFLKNYPHDVPLNWFDEQFKEVLNINIFNYPFNRERGWDEICDGNYKCLLMTTEIDDNEKLAAVNHFFGLNLTAMKRANIGGKKEYSTTYKEFKEKINLPKRYVDKMLNSPIVEHFYTKQQVNQFYEKWT